TSSNMPALGPNLAWDLSQLGTSGTIRVVGTDVTLSIADIGGGQVRVAWNGTGGRLQSAEDLGNDPFVDSDPAASSPASGPATGPSQFYRVRTGTNGYTFYDTEMLQLDISGGSLPAGAQIRISPTIPSLGKTAIQQEDNGTNYTIVSYFTNNIEM